MDALNTAAFLALNAESHILPDVLWANVTILGDTLVSLALLSLLAVRYPRVLAAGLLGGLLAGIVTHTIKPWLVMERPLAVLGEQAQVIGVHLHNFSFPSGHTTAAFVLAGVSALALQRKGATVLLFCMAALVGFSRIAVGAHWPADVLAGALIGSGSAWLGWQLAMRWQWSETRRGQRVLTAIFLVFSLLLFWSPTGYPQALGLQIAIAVLATCACLLTLWKSWHP
jgi:membrane-associated phospholipid phosphatase